LTHAAGWIEAYQLLEENQPIPEKLKNTILNNCNGIGKTMLHNKIKNSQCAELNR